MNGISKGVLLSSLHNPTGRDNSKTAQQIAKTPGTIIFRADKNGKVQAEASIVGEDGAVEHWGNQWVTDAKPDELASFINSQKTPAEQRFAVGYPPNPNVRAVNREIWQETDALMQDFYSGKETLESVQAKFVELAQRNFQVNKDNHMVYNEQDKAVMLKSFYSEFRCRGIGGAVRACGEEGKSLVAANPPKGVNGQGAMGVTYYNADYYYKSEELIKALDEGANQLAQGLGLSSFEPPEYDGPYQSCYKNFNTSWGNPLVATNEYMIDLTKEPPEGFTFLLRNDGADSSLTVSYRDASQGGKQVTKQVSLPFAPTSSKITVSEIRVEEVKPGQPDPYHPVRPKDYYNAGDRLQFEGDSEDASRVNAYLKNFNVYSYNGWYQNSHPRLDVKL